MPRSSKSCLCADCLREVPGFFDDNEVAQCTHCGGELCDCPDCIQTLQFLKAGERSASVLGLYNDLTSWNQRDGGKAVA